MRLLAALILLTAQSALATFTLATGYPTSTAAPTGVAASNCGGSATCYSVTVTSTTAGAFIGIIVLWGNTTTSLLGCFDGGDTFSVVAGARGTDTNGGGTDFCYMAAVTGSKTSVFVRASAGTPAPIVWVIELTFTNGPVTLDNSGTADRTTCTSCLGIAPSISGANDVVFQLAAAGGTASAINSSYTGTFTGGDGQAYLLNTTSTAQPTWTQTSSTMGVAYVSFKDSTTSAHNMPPAIY